MSPRRSNEGGPWRLEILHGPPRCAVDAVGPALAPPPQDEQKCLTRGRRYSRMASRGLRVDSICFEGVRRGNG